MTPEIWVPWVIALCAPGALLFSQWMNNRDRAADREQQARLADKAAERESASHWRDKRLEVHSAFMSAAERSVRVWQGSISHPHRAIQPEDAPYNYELTALWEAFTEVRLFASELTIALALDVVDAFDLQEADSSLGNPRAAWEALDPVVTALAAYQAAVRSELGTTA